MPDRFWEWWYSSGHPSIRTQLIFGMLAWVFGSCWLGYPPPAVPSILVSLFVIIEYALAVLYFMGALRDARNKKRG